MSDAPAQGGTSTPTAPTPDATPWHAIAADAAAARLQTDVEVGLSTAEADLRRGQYGANVLPEGKRRGPVRRFAQQLHNVLIYVLLGSGFVKLMLALWVDAGVIFGVVLINTLLGFIQEGRAERALDAIRTMLSDEARVVRDGRVRLLPAADLVPGDVVLLESGDRVPADLRLEEVRSLQTEEATLTGESVPVSKGSEPVAVDATLGDRRGMAFSGTLVAAGRARGVVVATGPSTELGRINALLEGVDAFDTPLMRQINRLGVALTWALAVVAVAMFAWGHWVRDDLGFTALFQSVVSSAVAVIPEGLPALVTITLAIGVESMARRNAIIRRLPAVETLGSVSRICSDKTGTLTLMEMMVVSATTARGTYDVTGEGYAPEGAVLADGRPVDVGDDAALARMAEVAVLCNDAVLRGSDSVWSVEGDPTEGALYPFAGKLGVDQDIARAARPRLDEIPFESEHKFMATMHASDAGLPYLLVKGAPEVIVAHCDRQLGAAGDVVALDRASVEAAGDRMAARGQRVLGLAWLEDPGVRAGLTAADLPDHLVLLGLVGMLDPPRREAIEAIRECHQGGIRVTMITGDHKITAAAVAKMLEIGDGHTALTGADIEAMDEASLQQAVRDVDVFARASPEHKLRLVKAIQANGQVVAMTGDGVNDAPALKRADIGVAMGIKGTDVTKEAADMVLADDNFASIDAAVKEGRTVYNNIEKALLNMVPTNIAQGLVIIAAVFAGFTAPITAAQILWVNMVASVALGLVLSFEPHEPDVMLRPPRRVDTSIISGFGLWRIGFIGVLLLAVTLTLFFEAKAHDASNELARSIAVNALVVAQVFYLLNSRFKTRTSLSIRVLRGNRVLYYGVGALVVLQALFTYAPPFQRIFHVDPIPARWWPWMLLAGVVFFLVVETEKAVIRRLGLVQR